MDHNPDNQEVIPIPTRCQWLKSVVEINFFPFIGGSLPTANTPSAVQAQNIFQSLQTGAIAGISLAGIGPLVAVFDLPQTNDNFRATAGIFEELNVQRRSRRGIRKQIGSFFKPIQRMVKGMIQIRRYEHTIHIKMAHLILIICCCNFLK